MDSTRRFCSCLPGTVFNILVLIILYPVYLRSEQAVVIVPVADLVSQPFEGSLQEVIKAYEALPISGDSCARAHQLLLHEVVEIVREHNGQVCIALPHRFYVGNGRHFPKSTYWMRKDQLITMKNLAHQGVDIKKISTPISYEKNNIEQVNKNVATLIMPVTIADQTYSAGTRFQIERSDGHYYNAWLFTGIGWEIVALPKEKCFVFEGQSVSERIRMFIDLVKRWAHMDDGVIPYVWGGCSVCETMEKNAFVAQSVIVDDGEDVRIMLDESRSIPYSGLDCSGIIARAAQIFSLPYYYKNTETLSRFMRPDQDDESLGDGDLVWFPGHVMIISDVKNNKILEARGYASGFGCVHEVPLARLFLNCSTYEQLYERYIHRFPLKLADSEGNLRFEINNFSIFKFPS